jgi:RimJ/RimL family protein N-acetyltransferase
VTAPATKPHDQVALRRARPDDCAAIWRWNFAPEVRAQSKRAEAVAFVEHERWFARRLADGDAPIWVIEDASEAAIHEVSEAGHQAVGVIRLDLPAPGVRGRARISIALDASARGRGIGRAAIAAACRAWRRPIEAEVFTDNRASLACFAACGFRRIATGDGLVTYHWDPET